MTANEFNQNFNKQLRISLGMIKNSFINLWLEPKLGYGSREPLMAIVQFWKNAVDSSNWFSRWSEHRFDKYSF